MKKKFTNFQGLKELLVDINTYGPYHRHFKIISKSMVHLNAEDKKIIILKYFAMLDTSEMAMIFWVTDKTMRRRINKAIKNLCSVLIKVTTDEVYS